MTTTLRDLVEAPERASSIPPNAMAGLLGELVLLLARLLVQISVTPTYEQAGKDIDRLLTVRETATFLSVRPPHVYELIHRRVLPAVRVGKYVRVRASDLHAWIENQREEGVDGKIQPGLSSPLPMSRPTTKTRGRKSR